MRYSPLPRDTQYHGQALYHSKELFDPLGLPLQLYNLIFHTFELLNFKD